MTDRAQLAFLGGDWPADLDSSLRCGTLGAHVEQSAPLPGTGDVWREIIDAEPLAVLRKLYEARRLVGIKNYGVPLQRGNERDTARDLEEELLDALAYATALEWWGVATVIRVVLLCVVTRRRGGS